MSVDLLATIDAQKQRWRWRCALCSGIGYAEDEPKATNDYERHYAARHPHKETE